MLVGSARPRGPRRVPDGKNLLRPWQGGGGRWHSRAGWNQCSGCLLPGTPQDGNGAASPRGCPEAEGAWFALSSEAGALGQAPSPLRAVTQCRVPDHCLQPLNGDIRNRKGRRQRSGSDVERVWGSRVIAVPFRVGGSGSPHAAEPDQASPDTGRSPLAQPTPGSSQAGPRSSHPARAACTVLAPPPVTCQGPHVKQGCLSQPHAGGRILQCPCLQGPSTNQSPPEPRVKKSRGLEAGSLEPVSRDNVGHPAPAQSCEALGEIFPRSVQQSCSSSPLHHQAEQNTVRTK